MEKTCKVCGSPLPPYKRKYFSDECQKLVTKRDYSKHSMRARDVRKRQKRLEEKIRLAKELGISYGELIAREWLNEQ